MYFYNKLDLKVDLEDVLTTETVESSNLEEILKLYEIKYNWLSKVEESNKSNSYSTDIYEGDIEGVHFLLYTVKSANGTESAYLSTSSKFININLRWSEHKNNSTYYLVDLLKVLNKHKELIDRDSSFPDEDDTIFSTIPNLEVSKKYCLTNGKLNVQYILSLRSDGNLCYVASSYKELVTTDRREKVLKQKITNKLVELVEEYAINVRKEITAYEKEQKKIKYKKQVQQLLKKSDRINHININADPITVNLTLSLSLDELAELYKIRNNE